MSRLEKTVEVDVPVRRAFEQLTRYEDYPRFMAGVREVQPLDETHLHWRCDDDGQQREWDSEITARIPDQLVAWRNLNDHSNIGQVRLEPLTDTQTRVRMSMEYDPQCPAEQVAATESRTAERIEGDLQRFKDLVETEAASAADASGIRPNPVQAWLPRLMDAWEEPLSAMRRMTQEMDGVFARWLGRPAGITNWTAAGKRSWSPPVEVARRPDKLVISADLPGIRREQVQVEINNDKLTIEGDWLPQPEDEQLQYRRSERTYGHFFRAIPLPDGIDASAASACMEDGVLEITLPVIPQQDQGRRLDINASPPQ